MPRINANQLTHISIVPGVTPVIGNFNERDAGSKPRCKRVVLHYTEHRGVPTTLLR
jgi:hypothetical protein